MLFDGTFLFFLRFFSIAFLFVLVFCEGQQRLKSKPRLHRWMSGLSRCIRQSHQWCTHHGEQTVRISFCRCRNTFLLTFSYLGCGGRLEYPYLMMEGTFLSLIYDYSFIVMCLRCRRHSRIRRSWRGRSRFSFSLFLTNAKQAIFIVCIILDSCH